MKKCSKCKIKKEFTQFHKNRARYDGYCNYCKVCDTKKANTLRKNNRKRKTIKIPEKKVCANCSTQKKEKDFSKNKNLADGLNPYCKVCTSKIMSLQNSKRRAKQASLNEKFSVEDYKAVFSACHSQCINCSSNTNLSIDHFYPLSKGYPLKIGNGIILCRNCNSQKSASMPENFFNKEVFNDALIAIAVSNILKNGIYHE